MRPYAFLVLNWCFWEQKPLAPGSVQNPCSEPIWMDEKMGIKYGTTREKLSARISIDLQRGFHAACTLQRAQQAAGSGL